MPLDDVFELIGLLLFHVGGQEDRWSSQTVILKAKSSQELDHCQSQVGPFAVIRAILKSRRKSQHEITFICKRL